MLTGGSGRVQGSKESQKSLPGKLKSKALTVGGTTVTLMILQSAVVTFGRVISSLWNIKRSCSDFDAVSRAPAVSGTGLAQWRHDYLCTLQTLVQIGAVLSFIGIGLFFWIAILIFSGIHGALADDARETEPLLSLWCGCGWQTFA